MFPSHNIWSSSELNFPPEMSGTHKFLLKFSGGGFRFWMRPARGHIPAFFTGSSHFTPTPNLFSRAIYILSTRRFSDDFRHVFSLEK